MSSLILLGLHYLLFQGMKHDDLFSFGPTESNTLAKPHSANSHNPTDLDLHLQQDLSGIAVLADKAVPSDSFSALKHVNDALNAWRATWDLRVFRETWCEKLTFFSDALPFWWLAKLYVLLHYRTPLTSPDSEFAIPRVASKDERNKMPAQAKILKWVSRFCDQKHQIKQELYDADVFQGVGYSDLYLCWRRADATYRVSFQIWRPVVWIHSISRGGSKNRILNYALL